MSTITGKSSDDADDGYESGGETYGYKGELMGIVELFRMFVMSRGDTEKCYLYCSIKYRVYGLRNRIHI